jgi:DNA repair protein RadC
MNHVSNDRVSFQSESYLRQTVKEMSPDQQPREKLEKYGAESLSDAELMAILLRTGSGKLNVIQMSDALLKHFGGMRKVARKNWKQLTQIPGIGRVKALTLSAVFEMARRMQSAELGDEISITCPEDANAYFGPRLRDKANEVFVVAFLNAAKVLTGHQIISSGGATATIVDPAEVLRHAMLNNANSIILLHNHPSGHAKASKADVQLTKRISESGKLLGIPVDDHIIIADQQFVSLKAEGLF